MPEIFTYYHKLISNIKFNALFAGLLFECRLPNWNRWGWGVGLIRCYLIWGSEVCVPGVEDIKVLRKERQEILKEQRKSKKKKKKKLKSDNIF